MARDERTELAAREIDRWDGGLGWMADPDETMQRASHAIADDGAVWVIDPVDTPGFDDRLDEVGEVAGVVVLLDRHKRDATTVATRHDVPVYLPGQLRTIRDAFDTELATTGYRTIPIVTNQFWREVALYHESDRTLIVPEAVGTGSHFRAPGDSVSAPSCARSHHGPHSAVSNRNASSSDTARACSTTPQEHSERPSTVPVRACSAYTRTSSERPQGFEPDSASS